MRGAIERGFVCGILRRRRKRRIFYQKEIRKKERARGSIFSSAFRRPRGFQAWRSGRGGCDAALCDY
jgi:hypothetical protein